MKTTSVLLTMAVLAVATPTTSDAKPQATCQTMCQRLADCQMSSYTKQCLDACKQYGYEASEEGRAQLAAYTRYTCKQIQSSLAGTDGHQHQRPPTRDSSARGASPRPPSTSAPGNADEAELDKLDKELNDLEGQLGNDEAELEKRSRSARGPARGAGAGAPARGAGGGATAPARGAQSSAKGRRPAPSGSSRWTCNAQGRSVYGYNVEGGGGDVRGKSTVSIPGSGGSKDEAASEAMSSCGSLMTTNLSTDRAMVLDASSEGQWGVRIEVPCHVTQCAPM